MSDNSGGDPTSADHPSFSDSSRVDSSAGGVDSNKHLAMQQEMATQVSL
jgi:hypothetical protein